MIAAVQLSWEQPPAPPEPEPGTPEAHVLGLLRKSPTKRPWLQHEDRRFRHAIANLRRLGFPVVAVPVTPSGGGGYKLATTPDELEATIADLYSRVREMSLTADALALTRDRLRVACGLEV